MNIFPGSDEILRIIATKKEDSPIGIYGSFSKGNREYLVSLKTTLTYEGYNARLSENMEKDYPQDPGEKRHAYSLRMSDTLTRESEIHIVFLFHEPEGQHAINTSACMELKTLYDSLCPRVLVIYESDSLRQCRSMLMGIEEVTKTKLGYSFWNWHEFTRYDPTQFPADPNLEDVAISYCARMIR